MSSDGCQRVRLCQGDCAEVSRCDCGHLHVSVGPMTLRVEEAVLRSLSETLGRAVAMLDRTAGCHCEEHAVPGGLKQ
jgi:hypothetical protein